jgi:hypothetical protein
MVWKYECVQILRQHVLKLQAYTGMTDGKRKSMKKRKVGGHGHNGTIFWVLEECSCWHFQVSSNDWRTVKNGIKIRHNVLQQMRDPTGILSPLQRGRAFKHFLFHWLYTWLLFPSCKTKCNFAFHRYYSNDKADSEQNNRLEAMLLYTEEKVLQMQETKSERGIHAYKYMAL